MTNPKEFINNFKRGWELNNLEDVFTNGNCFHFALILESIYDGQIKYDPVEGHFITKIGSKHYDITGEVVEPKVTYFWREMKIIEPSQYQRILANCVYKEE